MMMTSKAVIYVLAYLAACVVQSWSAWNLFARWGLDRPERLSLTKALTLLSLSWMVIIGLLGLSLFWGLLMTVILTSFVLSLPYHRLRTLDGLGLAMLQGVVAAQGVYAARSLIALTALGLTLAAWLVVRFGVLPHIRRRGQGFFACVLALVPGQWLQQGMDPSTLLLLAFGLIGLAVVSLRKQKERKPLLLFDLDGTLINSRPLVFETFRRVFAQKLPEHQLTEEELVSFFGPTLEVTFGKYFPPEEIESVIALYQKINLELHEDLLEEIPGALQMAATLHDRGYTLGIVSNKRHHPVEVGLTQSGLAPYFSLVYGKEDLPKGKPSPSGLIKAARNMGYTLDEVIYVGDNPSDIQAARNTAMYSIGYTLECEQKDALRHSNPCRMIDDLRLLENYLEEDNLWIDKSIWSSLVPAPQA